MLGFYASGVGGAAHCAANRWPAFLRATQRRGRSLAALCAAPPKPLAWKPNENDENPASGPRGLEQERQRATVTVL